jgi:Spy/CpxP family protein refolding chaperone
MRMFLVALVAGSVAACANDVTAPTVQPAPENSLAVASGDAMGHGRWGFGRRGFMAGGAMFAARRLPDNLKLTDAQRSQIKALVSSFRTAHQPDLQSLATAAKQARGARASGQTVEQRRAFFAQTAPARQRLIAAQKQLGAQIQNVLTADQKAWLASHRPSFKRNANHLKRNA